MTKVVAKYNGNSVVLEPKMSYMGISFNLPIVGKKFKVMAFKQDQNGKMFLDKVITSEVMKVKKWTEGIYIVYTRFSYYITKVINKSEDNVHFALINDIPVEGKQLSCLRIIFEGNTLRYVKILDTEIVKVEYKTGLYRIKTLDNTYVAFPTF